MGIVRSPVNSRLSLNFGFGVVSGHSAMPERAASLRWFQTFPPSPRHEEVRSSPDIRRGGMKSTRLRRPDFEKSRFGNLHEKLFRPFVTTKLADLSIDSRFGARSNTGLSTPGDLRLPAAYRQSGDENNGTFALGQCRPATRH